jgi:hypothetical protein
MISLYVSGIAAIVAAITIVAFFAVGEPWGTFNDFSYGVQMLAFIPVIFALRPIHNGSVSKVGRVAWFLGVATIVGFMVQSFLQTAVDVRLIDFGSLEPIPGLGPLALAVPLFLLFEVWLLVFGIILKRSGVKDAVRMSVVGMTSLALPAWIFWLARQDAIWA